MKVLSLSVHQFRNLNSHSPISIPEAPLIAILAPNASGKTNFLEALVMMLRGKSFRARNDECVEWGKDNFVVQGIVDYGQGKTSLSVQYYMSQKATRITEDNAPVSPVTFFGHYPLVLFLPEDAFLFSRGPVGRRNFINNSLASSNHYLASVVQYHRALRQRNAALKNAKHQAELASWTELVVEHARALWSHREVFATYLSSHVPNIYADIFHEQLKIEISFVPGASRIESFRELLDESWKYEQRYRYTLYGPHRDDIEVTVEGRDVSSSLSRGQMRGLAIACKVAAHSFIKQLLGHEPLLLFDEVLSELDPDRQRSLLEYIPAAQTIMTCSALPEGVRRASDVATIDVRSFVQTA